MTWLAAWQLDVALQTDHRHVHATSRLHQVSEEDVGEAGGRRRRFRSGEQPRHRSEMSSHTKLGPDPVSSTLYSPSTRRRRLHDSGPTDHLLSPADLPRYSAGRLPRKMSLSGPWWHQVHVQTPLAVLQLQPRAKRTADGVTEAVRALGRGELRTQLAISF